RARLWHGVAPPRARVRDERPGARPLLARANARERRGTAGPPRLAHVRLAHRRPAAVERRVRARRRSRSGRCPPAALTAVGVAPRGQAPWSRPRGGTKGPGTKGPGPVVPPATVTATAVAPRGQAPRGRAVGVAPMGQPHWCQPARA